MLIYKVIALRFSAENILVDKHNLDKLEAPDSTLHNVPTIDLYLKMYHPKKLKKFLNLNQSNTGGLAQLLHIKVNAR